jgi:cytochrome c556
MFRMSRRIVPFAVAAMGLLAPSARTAVPDTPDAIGAAEIIAARQELMLASEQLMRPIDTITVDDSVDPESMRENASAIAAILLALPQMFPSNTDLYDADAELPLTLALPAVWESFQEFYDLASVASATATSLAETYDAGSLKNASLELRGACDACHAVYLLPYEPPHFAPHDESTDDSIFDFSN